MSFVAVCETTEAVESTLAEMGVSWLFCVFVDEFDRRVIVKASSLEGTAVEDFVSVAFGRRL